MMRACNRGNVPAPHVPPGAGKPTSDAGEEIFFDSGLLSHVKDWMEGGEEAAATAPVESERSDSRLSNPNRRLGVGAKPKKSLKNQSEPTALQKKLARKREHQELGDATVGEIAIHGVVEDDIESEGESKTASFKGNKKGYRNDREVGDGPSNMTVDKLVDKKGEAENGSASGDKLKREEDDGGVSSQKRKTRRKKGKSRAAGSDGGGDMTVSEPQPPAAENTNAPVEEPLATEQGPVGVKTNARESETRKQRRGWGKARSNPPADAADSNGRTRDGENTALADSASEERKYERPKRKKMRSRQKNIRKDKRPSEQRPAYLRIGDPEFSGRGLTLETRKVLGLPPDDIVAPSAGWEKPGKSRGEDVGWVIDKQPAKVPKRLEDNGDTSSAVVMVDTKEHLDGVGGSRPSRISKYKNLPLSLATKSTKRKTS